LLFVAESQVSVEECGGWDVTAPSSPVKFVENRNASVRRPAGA
jgi:hypothetical protein